MTRIFTSLTIALCALFISFAGSQKVHAQVASFEYFFDADPGFGNGTPITTGFTAGNSVNFTASLSASGLSSGFHQLYFRGKSAAGLWGHYQSRSVYVTTIAAGNGEVSTAEYFFDADPGVGAATVLPLTQGATVNQTVVIPVSNLGSGFHQLVVRVKNTNGIWSHYQSRSLYVTSASVGSGDITSLEYFFDADPGVGNGVSLPLTQGSVVTQNVAIPISGLSAGFHQLFLRCRNTSNIWSHYQSRAFMVSSIASNGPAKIAGAEYFLDADPGIGAGTPIPINPPVDTINQVFTLALPGTLSDGLHNLVIRVRNEQGQWSHYQTKTFINKKPKPGSGSAISFDGTNDYASAEYSVAGQPNTFSYEVWVKPTGTITLFSQGTSGYPGTSGQKFLIKPYGFNNASDAGMGLSVGTNGIQVFEYANSYLPALLSWSGTIDKWTHIAVVYDNKQPMLYVNGMLVATGLTSLRTNVYPYFEKNTEVGRGDYGYYAGQMDELRVWNKALTQTEIRDWMCKKLTSTHPGYATLAAAFNNDEGTGLVAYDDARGGTLTLTNGASFATSGAAIGNLSTYSYGGAASTTTLANPTRGDVMTATLTAGLADGIQVYCVTDTPNNRAGTTCLGDNNGYFGVFAANGSTPQYNAVYNYSGFPMTGFNESQIKLYERADNSTASWTNSAATLDTAANTASTTGTPRGEYIISNAIVSPTIAITASPATPVCAGTTINFTSTITNGGSAPQFQWKLNSTDIPGANGATYTSSTLINGDIITCELVSTSTCVSPSNALSNALTTVFSSSLVASVSITASPGGSICAGTSVVFSATPVNGGTAPVYQWKINGLANGGNASTYTSSSFVDGDVVTCEMTTNAICAAPALAVSSTVVMDVLPVVTPAISIVSGSGNAICSGTSVTFTASIANGGTTPFYQWKKNGINVGTDAPTYTDNALLNQDVITCTLTSNATCGSPQTVQSTPITLTVSSSAAPTVTISSNSGTTICAGATVVFSATITNGGSMPAYSWVNNGLVVSTTPTYTSSILSNNDSISLVVTSNASCASVPTASSDTLAMTVTPYGTPSVSIAVNLGATACIGSPVTFTATVVNGGNTPTYEWKKNGTATGANSAIYTTSSLITGDVITCEVTTSIPCYTQVSATSNAVTMNMLSLPTANAGPDQTILRGSSVALTATGGGSYLWSSGDTTSTTVVSPVNTSNYVVIVSSANGCSATDTATVTVNFSSLAIAPASYNFGEVVLNTTANAGITITNNGTLTETVSAASVATPFGTSFTTQSVAPQASVTIPVTFTPTGLLLYQQSMTITTSTGNFSVVLNGKGVVASPAWTISSANYNFGNVSTGASLSHVFQVFNTGNVPIALPAATSSDIAFVPTALTTSIPVGGSVPLEVNFMPTAIAPYTGIITLQSPTLGLNSLVINVSGNGYVPGARPQVIFEAAAPFNGTSGVDKPVAPAGTFNYRVTYKSITSVAPLTGFPKVGIDLNGDGDFIDAGEGVYPMSKIGTGTNWAAGESFTYTQNLSVGSNYGYQFIGIDSLGNTAVSINSNYVAGPLVTNQGLDLAIYASDITFSNNNPAVGQQFTVSAVVHNNSPYSASNVPVRFYKDSVFLASTTIAFISANSTSTITQNFSFAPDGFYPIKVWIDSANTLNENNPLNNYAIRPVIVGNFTIPGAIATTAAAYPQSCPVAAVTISGYASYSGLNLTGTPPALGATVTVTIANGPTLTTNTVTGGYWSVYSNQINCGVPYSYTVTVTDYTLSATTGTSVFNAGCVNCGYNGFPGTGSPVTHGSYTTSGCLRDGYPFNYTVSYTNPCNHDTLVNDTTLVYVDNVLAYTHSTSRIDPCVVTTYANSFTLASGNHTLSYTHVYFDTAGRHELSGSETINVELDLPDLSLGNFAQTGSTSFSVRDYNSVCVAAGPHKIHLYDSLAGLPPVLIDSFTVTGVGSQSYQPWVYNNPALQMGYHYLTLVTDPHLSVVERNESNNQLEAVLYVPFPELTVTDIVPSATNLSLGTQINFSAQLHNTGSSASAFNVKFYADGIQIGNAVPVTGLAGGGSVAIVSDVFTVPAGNCPIEISAMVDADLAITELLEDNNLVKWNLATDLLSGVGCYAAGSSCNPYVAVKNIPMYFGTVVTNAGSRDAQTSVVKFALNGVKIGSDNITTVVAKSSAATGITYSFPGAGNYAIQVFADSGASICESSEVNNSGLIYITVQEGLPDLEILSQYISPSNLNPNPLQSVSVVASIFNKGNQISKPGKVRFWVDGVQLGSDVSIDSIGPGLDTTVMATATYYSATIGPKVFKVKADVLDDNVEYREDNNEATRAIIVGGAPDFARSKNEGITFSKAGFRKGQTISVRNYIRNYGGDNGTASLNYYLTDNTGLRTLLSSTQFTINSNDSAIVTANWLVNMVGNGRITTEIVGSNPQEFNEFNNTDSLDFVAGPELNIISLNTPSDAVCENGPLNIGYSILKGGQTVSFEWFHNQLSTGITSATSYSVQSVAFSDAGDYELRATDTFGTEVSPVKTITVNPVLIPSISVIAQPGTVICAGNWVKYRAIAVNGGPNAVYQWKKNGVVVPMAEREFFVDSLVTNGQTISCELTSNAPCTSTIPVGSNVLTMTVNGLSGLVATNASQTNDNDSGMFVLFTDLNCGLIAAVSTDTLHDLGTTTASTFIDPAFYGFVRRNVEITPTNNLPAEIKLYFLQSDFADYNANVGSGQPLLPTTAADPAIDNIVIYQYHGLPSSGTTGPGGRYNANDLTVIPTGSITKVWNSVLNYWEITFPVNGFSGHFLKADLPVPLAIRLGNISAQNQGSVNEVKWNTLIEATGDYFILERSTNGKNFSRLAEVKAKGSSSEYVFTDTAPEAGVNYYRLQLRESNGNSGMSKIVSAVAATGAFVLEAFPNPTRASLNITTRGAGTNGSVRLTDITGKVVRTIELTGKLTTIDISTLSAGVYFLKYTDDTHHQTLRVVKE